MTRLLLAVLVLAAACETEREVRPLVQTQTVAAASCLAQATQTQTVSGVQAAAFTNTGLADNTGIDASTAQWRTGAPISIRLGGGANVCFHGGETIGSLPPAMSWSAALNYYAVVPDGPNVIVEGVRTFDRGDGVAFGSNAPNWTLRGAYIHYARDGCVENHFVFAGTVDDALLDGGFIGFASRPYPAGTARNRHAVQGGGERDAAGGGDADGDGGGRSGRGGGALPAGRAGPGGGGDDGPDADEVHAGVGLAGERQRRPHLDGHGARRRGHHDDLRRGLGDDHQLTPAPACRRRSASS